MRVWRRHRHHQSNSVSVLYPLWMSLCLYNTIHAYFDTPIVPLIVLRLSADCEAFLGTLVLILK